MKSSTVAINSHLNVAYDRFHKFVRAYDEGDTTRERLSNNIYALRNNIASLSQKAETKTAREKIERFVKMCDTRLQLLAKGGDLMKECPRIIYQIALTLEDNYIIVYESEYKECAEFMMKWYLRHENFFNGTFSVQEVI